jgi:4-hydroxy-3-methylbut-2-enyl diphosphate reductase IspH
MENGGVVVVFRALLDSAVMGELMLVDNGYCRYHVRNDGVLVIYEIIVTVHRHGIATAMLERLKSLGAVAIEAKCPSYSSANEWYRKRGFVCTGMKRTSSGVKLNIWRLSG